MKFAQYNEMIYSDYDPEAVRLITDQLGAFTKTGLEAPLSARRDNSD